MNFVNIDQSRLFDVRADTIRPRRRNGHIDIMNRVIGEKRKMGKLGNPRTLTVISNDASDSNWTRRLRAAFP